ncbi:CD276 antigen homolog isoform X3 [Erpetoichthys calabaricus]|uniref:CD276 antigen homolog isoform X1 n=1 Tax=Erpetoichthys calabaricus TaxID=27687 RepID=UPI002234233F|nr:CD276 antigen homolog isoform X1 [Erpetoichthys calabaricus]XP_051781974.1 CD276 antigen homolog isoform X2 [Erpetoichthys calabaricus]XP_051781975.1 CD276 antigen homolog isoform X1 [Erpetoichthys calabaricus]XP_051781976.1 CD276 antigen homolog isoform X3 [Erpetoichthys calabaricus]
MRHVLIAAYSGKDSGLLLDLFKMRARHLHITLLLALNIMQVLPEDIVGISGNDVLLPCVFSAPKPLDVQTVSFAWDRLPNINMLFFSSGKSNIAPGYTDRISLNDDQIDKGNISLVLKNIQKTDEGNYMCYPPQDQQAQDVKLTVKEPEASPVVTEKTKSSGEEPGNTAVNLIPQKYVAFLISSSFLLHLVG